MIVVEVSQDSVTFEKTERSAFDAIERHRRSEQVDLHPYISLFKTRFQI
jgi:hypothetical protein